MYRSLHLLLFISIHAVCRGQDGMVPVFTSDMNQHVISEGTQPGAIVYTLQATSADVKTGDSLRFFIRNSDLFAVNATTGEVSLLQPLDRETKDAIKLTVAVEDQAGNGSEIPITVIISDENDNAPVFSQTLYEGMAGDSVAVGSKLVEDFVVSDPDLVGEIIQVSCVDNDVLCGAVSIISNVSSASSYRGSVILKTLLDSNSPNQSAFTLLASDGVHNSTAEVRLSPRKSDLSPRASTSVTNVQTGMFHEDDAVGTLVMTVRTASADAVTYSLLENPNDIFDLDADSGRLTTAKMVDRETLDSAGLLRVRVRVTGTDVNDINDVDLIVVVGDANDEAPSFDQEEYFTQVSENLAAGSPLADLRIVAADRDSAMNSMFDLELVDPSGLFVVEPKSAVGLSNVAIRLDRSTLDYENPNQQKFILLLVARESKTEQRLSSTSTVIVTVEDENDNPPFFDSESYTLSVPENATEDTEIGSVSARDRDSGIYGAQGFRYQLSATNDLFTIDNKTGALSVLACATPGKSPCLDYEGRSTYFLTVQVTDDDGRGGSAVVPVRVQLTDVNDNPPRFNQFIFHATVDEGAVKFDPPFIVEALDNDTTSILSYEILDGNPDGLFTVDAQSGEIGITKLLEVNSSQVTTEEFMLTLQVSDGTSRDTTTLKVSVRDVNNHQPVFQQSLYNVTISELDGPGSNVTRVSAMDADFGENARLTYKIERSSYNRFRIGADDGLLQVTKALDYDEQSSYSLQIAAVDHGFPALTGRAVVLVNIDDRNNKLPRFTPVSQHAQTVETVQLNTVVHTLSAVDPDARPGSLRYSLIEPITAVDKDGREVRTNTMYKNFFAVNPTTGDIFVTEHLDRGAAAVVTITTRVMDSSASPAQQATGMVTITILDVNEHPPVFSRPWSAEEPLLSLVVAEEQPVGSVVGKVTATDPDSPIGGYEILPVSPFFDIDPRTGIVTNKQRLDYESATEFNMTVVAHDAGIPPLSSSAQVTVNLLNVNDQNPVFSSKMYTATVAENADVGHRVLTVSASDGDAGSFGLITYSLTGENAKYFSIDASGAIVVSDPDGLDRERSPTLTLLVAASDLAPPGARRTTIVQVEIELEDVNDNDPKFLVNSYRATVAETLPLLPPPPIVQIAAVDLDAGINSALRYNIIGGNDEGLFRLDPVTGILYPVVSLAGKPREYSLSVEVRDLNGTGSQFDRATVTITVQSVNQHKPKFTVPSLTNATVRVPENAADESFLVLVLKAEDADAGQNGLVSYHIRAGEELVQETAEFNLDASSGELRTRMTLDRESRSSYELLLVAKDRGIQTSYETLRLLTVIVDDANDNEPEFPAERRSQVAPYHFRIEENVRPDTAVGQVQATDPDIGLNAKVYYHILEGNQGDWFYIDRTHGFVYNKVVLDREQRSFYDLLIKATNDPQYNQVLEDDREKRQTMVSPSNTRVHIDVVDINDNPPHFEKDTFYAGVDYSSNSDKLVLQIDASDPDEGVNGTLSYFIRSSNLFHMGSNVSSGSVVPSPFHVTTDGRLLTDSLMAEYNQDRFVLEVVAREEAAPFREDSARVHVWVYEPDQLSKIVVNKTLETAVGEREQFGDELRNATQLLIVIDELRHHVDDDGSLQKNRSDIFVHGVDRKSNTIAVVPDVLRAIDLHYDVLRSFHDTSIINVLSAKAKPKKVMLEPAIIALIALLIVLFVGFFMVIFTCCCIRNWHFAPPPARVVAHKSAMRERLVRRGPPPPLEAQNSTENPLWIDKYVKPYEEQELSMRVASDSESPARLSNSGAASAASATTDQPNPYATIQKPRRALPSIHLGDEVGESNDYYATLESPYQGIRAPRSSGPQIPGIHPSSSTSFIVPNPVGTPRLVMNQHGEPVLVAELI